MPAVASETKVAPFTPAPAVRTSGRASDDGDTFSALVDDSAPPQQRSAPPSRTTSSRADAPARDRDANPADDKSTAADRTPDTNAQPDPKSHGTSGSASDAKADAKSDAKTAINGAAEQAAADAAPTADGTSTDTKADPAITTAAAVVIPAIAAAIPTATPSDTVPTGDATSVDALVAASPAAGEIATPTLKPQQAVTDTGKVQGGSTAADAVAPDTAACTDAGKPATTPATVQGKPGEAVETKPAAAHAATPDDHPAVAHRTTDGAANDPAAIKTDATPTPPSLHNTAQPANAATSTSPAHVANATATAQPIPLNAVAVEIAARAGTGKNRFEIRLDPPELGKIDVRLDIDKHGQVTSRLIVEKAETLDLLRRDAPQLERALQDAGLKTSGNGLQFSLQQQMSQQHDEHPSGSAATAQILVADETAASDVAARSYSSLAALRGGIDIRV